MYNDILEYIDQNRSRQSMAFGAYQIEKIAGGQNNLLFRCIGSGEDFAVKFTIDDARDRAGREFYALQVLREVGLNIAPVPLMLDRETYRSPVVLQSWVEGDVSKVPPEIDLDWQYLLSHVNTIHRVLKQDVNTCVENAFLDARTPEACVALVDEQIDLIPNEKRPASLVGLRKKLAQISFPIWDSILPALARLDHNPNNFVRCKDRWFSVDWENSGWTDPAFDFVHLITHPQYLSVTAERIRWAIENYDAPKHDHNFQDRVGIYYKIVLIFWVARIARLLYETPIGKDQRLVERSKEWEEETRANLEKYVGLAEIAMRTY